MGHEGLEPGLSGFGGAIAGQPHPHANNVHGRCRENRLEVGFRRAPIAGPADAKGADGLGDRAFNTRPLGILGFLGGGLFALPGRLQAHLWFMGADGNGRVSTK